LAKIHVRQEKYRKALPEIDAAVRLAPENQNVHFMRGRILLKLGRRPEGEKEMARSKELLDAAAAREKLPSAMGNDDDEPIRNPELAQPQ
jgi:Flp pilus assembly protein TadD